MMNQFTIGSPRDFENAEKWWAREDSNLRPMDYESTALTN